MTSIQSVVACDSCSGCGGCSVATGGQVLLQITPRQTYEPVLDGADERTLAQASAACPFSDETPDEDAVAGQTYADLPVDPRLGRYRGTYAGRILDEGRIVRSSSGGMTTWILSQLLERDLVDGIIHVGRADGPLFEYVVSNSVEELELRRKSQYFPVNFAERLLEVRGDGRRYAIVGIPCAMKAVRHVMAEDEVLAEQLRFLIGIVCGHLKSMAYAESFAWQLGVPPNELETVDFRLKDPERTSREYGFGAKSSVDGSWHEAKTLSLVGGSWGHAVFQLGACDYCDDIFAETADVVLGDAWLAKYEIDWRGTNVILTRSAVIDQIVQDGAERGDLELDLLSLDGVAATQGGNFRHRREGLAVRLADDRVAGRWTPRKRVQPNLDAVDDERRTLIRKRRNISRVSHDLFARARSASRLDVYLDGIRPLIDDYQSLTKMTFGTRLRNKAKRETWKLIGKVRRR